MSSLPDKDPYVPPVEQRLTPKPGEKLHPPVKKKPAKAKAPPPCPTQCTPRKTT